MIEIYERIGKYNVLFLTFVVCLFWKKYKIVIKAKRYHVRLSMLQTIVSNIYYFWTQSSVWFVWSINSFFFELTKVFHS